MQRREIKVLHPVRTLALKRLTREDSNKYRNLPKQSKNLIDRSLIQIELKLDSIQSKKRKER